MRATLTLERQAMDAFLKVHDDAVTGALTMFDRVIFRGYLSNLFPEGATARFLARQGVLPKDFAPFVEQTTAALKTHVQELAAAAGRPYEYLEAAPTKASGVSKEDRARALAERDAIQEGLICFFAVLEPCKSFVVHGDRATHKLVVRRQSRKCLHFYPYLLEAEIGFMHVRLQSWFPFDVQIYLNGRKQGAAQYRRRPALGADGQGRGQLLALLSGRSTDQSPFPGHLGARVGAR
jgi:hypothetical protein